DLDDVVRDAAQEQIPSLATDIRGRRGHLARQLALQGYGVLVDALGNRVIVGIRPRLERTVVRIVDEVGDERTLIDREGPVADRRADAIAFHRLNLILG